MINFSVLISIYYKEKPDWFRMALESVFAQTVQPTEIILVKDGPLTDDLEAVIKEFEAIHPIFKIVINEKNLGLGLSLRKGVEVCSNEIIARMDTDDIIPFNRFEKQLKKIEEGYDVVSCWSRLFMDGSNEIIAIKKRPEYHNDIVKLAHRRSPVCHAATFIRKSSVMKAGNYLHRQYYEDYNLWVRMIQSGSIFYNIQEVLYDVRTTEEQLNRRSGFSYLKNELSCLNEFYKMGFYSLKDLLVNSSIRIAARLTPSFFRSKLFKRIWNHKN